VLVSLGASEKLALLSLGNQLLPHGNPRPASARHCRKLIHLLRPTHSTWSRIPGVHPPAFIALLLPSPPYSPVQATNSTESWRVKKNDKLPTHLRARN
jgi:hypothetical protein